VLEAMAHQLPVIATDLDIATCDYFKPQENILPLGDADSFASTVKRLRVDHAHWLYLSTRARDTVEQFANWKHYGNAMRQIIDDLTLNQRR
jgi:glycosyltransferase involved in cell wall biosynthesis